MAGLNALKNRWLGHVATPGQLLQRNLRSTSSHSLFTFPYPSHTSALPSLFLHIPSLFPRLPHGTPHRPHHAGSSATIPPMLSTILSPFKLIPGFRPLFSGLFISLAYKTLHPVCNTQMHDFAINGRQFVCQLKDARVLACDSSKHDRQWRSPPCTTWRRVTRKM